MMCWVLAQKILISTLLIILGATTFYFVWSIGQGFNKTRQIIIKLEKSLKLYDKNYYDISDSILPPEYYSKKTGIRGHFKTLNVLIVVLLLSLLVLIWVKPYKRKLKSSVTLPEQKQIKITDVNNK